MWQMPNVTGNDLHDRLDIEQVFFLAIDGDWTTKDTYLMKLCSCRRASCLAEVAVVFYLGIL